MLVVELGKRKGKDKRTSSVVLREDLRFVDEHGELHAGVGNVSSRHDVYEAQDGFVVRVVLLG
jgi:hypothetical protein